MLRESILVRDLYRCQAKGCGVLCSAKGQAHVDHIDGDPNNNATTNLQTLCVSCHSRKTAREDGGFGNPDRVVIGCDDEGWPLQRGLAGDEKFAPLATTTRAPAHAQKQTC
ncbi:MAG: HNH endonuclease [Pseudomonadota bacterium]|uniref:HNH endonuclease n=1 Tax=Stenotrophomonas maltophilia TaxID=40324 RepID=UPI001F2B79B9|nr:HNH endonuclease [Stenotrophomonas maltophilia]